MKKFATKILIFSLISVALLSFSQFSFAENLSEAQFPVDEVLNLGEDEQPASYFRQGDSESPVVSFILSILNFATGVMGSLAIIFFIIAGFRMMLSQGDQQAIDSAKDIFKYTLIGLIVAFLSYIITIFVQSIFIP